MRRNDLFPSTLWLLGIIVLACGCGAGSAGKGGPAKAGKPGPAKAGKPGESAGESARPEGGLLVSVSGGKGVREFEVDGERVSGEALSDVLGKKAAEIPVDEGSALREAPVVVRVSPGVPTEAVFDVLMACARKKLYRIVYRMRGPGTES